MTRRKLKRLRRLFNEHRRLYHLPSGLFPFERYIGRGNRVRWLTLACDAEDYHGLPDFTLCGAIDVRFPALVMGDLRQRAEAATADAHSLGLPPGTYVYE